LKGARGMKISEILVEANKFEYMKTVRSELLFPVLREVEDADTSVKLTGRKSTNPYIASSKNAPTVGIKNFAQHPERVRQHSLGHRPKDISKCMYFGRLKVFFILVHK
jgi:hypothetical protein